MWSRPDIQFNPDILISNFNMLSAMLSRDYESNMLIQLGIGKKRWKRIYING